MTARLLTNNVYRDLLSWDDVPEHIRASEFDYIDDADGENAGLRFVKYRHCWYDVYEFMTTSINGWDGQHTDSFFSAVLVRFDPDDCTRVVMGLYLC